MKLVDWFVEHYATLQAAQTPEEAFANPLARLTIAGVLCGLLLAISLASSAAEAKKQAQAASECRRRRRRLRGHPSCRQGPPAQVPVQQPPLLASRPPMPMPSRSAEKK